MANEVTRDSDATFTALHRQILVEARAAVVLQPTFMIDDIGGEPTLAKKYSKHPTTSDAGSITDGTAMSNTAVNPTSVTVTASGVGLTTDVTDFSSEGSLLTPQEVAENFRRALVSKIEADAASLLPNFSTTVGTSGADLTIGNWISALFEVENADEDMNIVSGLHPVQVQDLRTAVQSAGGAIFGNPQEAGVQGLLSSIQTRGAKGEFFGVPILGSTKVETANSGADRAGAMYSAGRALVWLWKWRPRMEFDRTIKLPGTSLALTACYGTGELFDGAGVSIITDA